MEPLTTAQVTAVLRDHVSHNLTCGALSRGPIGNGQETWFVQAVTADADLSLVVRRTAEAGPLEWTSRADEAAVMQRVAEAGVPVPRVRAVVSDPTVLGAPFMVMDRVTGSPVLRAETAERAALSRDLVEHLWRLHKAALPDPDDRTAAAATRAEIIRWRERYRTHRVASVPLLDALLAWADRTVPEGLDQVPAIQLWGDAGAHNALGRDGRITGMLDWELAHHGHPLEDLAGAIWIEGEGGVPQAVFIDAYEAASGQTVDRDVLRYFLTLTCLTRSIMIIAGAAAFVNGRSSSPTLAGLGLDLPAQNLGRAAELAGWGRVPELDPEDLDQGDLDLGPHPSGAQIDEGIARFLRDEVLSEIADGRTRRELKTAAALLDTAAARARLDGSINRLRAQATSELEADLSARGFTDRVGSIADRARSIADRVESEADLADLRPLVRQYLLHELALDRALLRPLRNLYG